MQLTWSIDLANRIMLSARYKASLYKDSDGYSVHMVLPRTDVSGADNLGVPLELEIAESARIALRKMQR